ncbi:MAG: cell division protein FtsQ/DivIB [Actinomycetota bacterium]|nr:FtsQ-type POTRA domain-containing protein [Actinomycetota bacterium]
MRFLKALIYIVIGGGFAYGVTVALGSQALHLDKVEVIGNSRVQAKEVVDAARLRKGANLLQLSTSVVADHVGKIAWIDTVLVERIIPSTIRITVKERKPAATVVIAGKTYLVDPTGIVLEEGGGSGLQVEGLPIADPAPGGRISSLAFRDSLLIFKRLPRSVSTRVAKVHAESVDRLTFELDDGGLIIYGAAEDIDAKNYAITSLMARASADHREIASLDVRVPARPALRPR